MTDIEQKALALVNEVRADRDWQPHLTLSRHDCSRTEALCRAIEQHEAFRQEVSDAVKQYWASLSGAFVAKPPPYMARFIIAKPDPLVEALNEVMPEVTADGYSVVDADELRAAIEKRGGKIVWGEG